MSNGFVYIFICSGKFNIKHNQITYGSDEMFHIDSVWTSERKATKRCNILNSNDMKEEREEHLWGTFYVINEVICK